EFNDESLFAVVFEAARGKVIDQFEDYTPDLMKSWGTVIGQLHKSIKNIETPRRLQWHEEPGVHLAEKSLSDSDPYTKIYNQIKGFLTQLEKPEESFGLIHADVHNGNFLVDQNNKITVFDFDDSVYHWLVYDLAVVKIAMKTVYQREGWPDNRSELWTHFLEAYKETYPISNIWERRIEIFCYWREVLLYFWITTRLNTNEFLPEDKKRVSDYRQRLSDSLNSFDPEILS
ncbi:MAG: phosphotransferase, partial [Bdellovibrionales bacterium]|nr:phosphotransferase [Bdellovibrionales bacterium]